jgi:hypothetical protein
MLLCPVKLTCGQSEHIARYSLLDTGAGVCHMTYRMWLDMRLHEICWNNNPTLCRLMGINTPDEMEFDTLPLVSTTSILGDGSEAKVYEIKIDKLQLGIPKLGFNHCIELENITVRLINLDRASFIIGWNVLKYLDIHYTPSLSNPSCQLTLTDEGLTLFHHERQNKIANFMQSMFNYSQVPTE